MSTEIPSPGPVVSCHCCRGLTDGFDRGLFANTRPPLLAAVLRHSQISQGGAAITASHREEMSSLLRLQRISAASLQLHVRVHIACRNKSTPESNQDKGRISHCAQLGVLSASQTAGFLPLFPPPLYHLPNNKDF